MLFPRPAVLLSALAAASSALGSTLTHRTPAVTLDVCADIKIGLGVLPLLGVKGDICLCLSLLDLYVNAHVGADVSAPARQDIRAVLELLINTNGGKKECQYPPHYVPECSSSDPCGYHCTDGYKRKGNNCECPAPKHDCGNKCSDSPCPSGGYRKRDMQPLQSLCPPGYEMCGVYSDSWASRSSWECVNTRTNLESCGGCVTPIFGKRSSGQDCSAIKGVSSVDCHNSQCRVTSCRKGWVATASGDDCVKIMI